ncbi:MAG: acetyl-CoA carboxylase biotin carboxylase subunit [Pseudomonadota bacterium]
MFRRILIANRGEIACRIIRSCREMKIETVAVYSTADREAKHVRDADQSVCIGGPSSQESYLNMEAILEAAERTDAKAIHPGYGFLSENALFAELCRQHRFTFVGPSSRVIALMGDKATARRTMAAAGIPVVPGSEGLVARPEDALALAKKFGFPVVLKATAGGGGKGMRICQEEGSLESLFREAALEAQKAFGNAGLYVEKFIEQGRHIEFQFLGDAYGQAVHLGERECSVQRHHQKLIEESPSPAIDEATRTEMGEKVRCAVAGLGYVGAGTMEFLRDPEARLYFMEVNTRLQVEHPVTEMRTGIDIVKEQIALAANHPLSIEQGRVTLRGHALECRINAEDPFNGFRPSPGRVERFNPPDSLPDGALRLDTHITAGAEIPMYYDSLISKLIVWSPDRKTTIRGMTRALKGFDIAGIKTTIPLHLKILADSRFVSGQYHTGLLSEMGV